MGGISLRRVTDPSLQNRHGRGRDFYPGATIPTTLQARRSKSHRSEAAKLQIPDVDAGHLGTSKASFQAQRPRKRRKRLHPTWSTHSPTWKTSHHQPWFVPASEQCFGFKRRKGSLTLKNSAWPKGTLRSRGPTRSTRVIHLFAKTDLIWSQCLSLPTSRSNNRDTRAETN